MEENKTACEAQNGCFNSNRREIAAKLVAEGKTNREIAEVLNLNYTSVSTTLGRWGIKRDENRACRKCGKPIGTDSPLRMYCETCRKQMDTIWARNSSQKCATVKTCEYCGKEFRARTSQKYCSQTCYRKAVAEGKYKRTKNWLRRRDGKIDIEIRIAGKTSDRLEGVDYYDAREIWHRGWLGQGYAALITVDGRPLNTIPQITKFFGFGREDF